MITEPIIFTQTNNDDAIEDFAISKFLRFLKHIKLIDMLSKLPDHRQQKKIEYTNYSLLLWALSVFFFRQESKNALNTTILDLPIHKQAPLLNFLGVAGDSLPKRDCVDDYLASIDSELLNDLLIQLFHTMNKGKLFYNHAETLLPGNSFHLGVDGYWIHNYSSPHAEDEAGNCCPYCLPRVHKRGEPKEWREWLHIFVTFVMIFPNGFKMPIYIYPLKASQVNATATDEKLKQECELNAAHVVLPILRKKLGRLPITALLDSLYANEPIFRLLDQLNMNHIIVRQDETFKSIGRQCDELSATELYKRYQDSEIQKQPNGKRIERTAKWFNNIACGKESYVNVLRFSEITKNDKGEITKEFYTEWLTDRKIDKSNWRSFEKRGRMRQNHEDMHNTGKNRGFAAKHDYARANPALCLNWKLIMFLAFAIFELFSFTIIGKEAKGKRSWMKFAMDLLQQLVEVSWSVLSLSPAYQKAKIQFRYEFAPP
jgi:hypothetical protein